MELNVNVKVTLEASPTILGLLNGWMRQLEQQQASYLNVLMDTVDARLKLDELANAVEPEKAIQVVEEKVQKADENLPPATENAQNATEKAQPAEEPLPQKEEQEQAVPMSQEQEDELRRMASAFVKADSENRAVLRAWLDSNGFERVTKVTCDKLEELREVLKVA